MCQMTPVLVNAIKNDTTLSIVAARMAGCIEARRARFG